MALPVCCVWDIPYGWVPNVKEKHSLPPPSLLPASTSPASLPPGPEYWCWGQRWASQAFCYKIVIDLLEKASQSQKRWCVCVGGEGVVSGCVHSLKSMSTSGLNLFRENFVAVK